MFLHDCPQKGTFLGTDLACILRINENIVHRHKYVYIIYVDILFRRKYVALIFLNARPKKVVHFFIIEVSYKCMLFRYV